VERYTKFPLQRTRSVPVADEIVHRVELMGLRDLAVERADVASNRAFPTSFVDTKSASIHNASLR
jgi:hypothetical protein